jgi:hypothetical protein
MQQEGYNNVLIGRRCLNQSSSLQIKRRRRLDEREVLYVLASRKGYNNARKILWGTFVILIPSFPRLDPSEMLAAVSLSLGMKEFKYLSLGQRIQAQIGLPRFRCSSY